MTFDWKLVWWYQWHQNVKVYLQSLLTCVSELLVFIPLSSWNILTLLVLRQFFLSCRYYETSAATGQGVHEMFSGVLSAVVEAKLVKAKPVTSTDQSKQRWTQGKLTINYFLNGL